MFNTKVEFAIVSPLKEELEYFSSFFSNCEFKSINIYGFNFKIYNYRNVNTLLAYTGIGTSFAASALTLIHTKFHPDYVFLSGCAGGINNQLKIRDVVIAETCFEAEVQNLFTLLKDTPFESSLIHPLKNMQFPSNYDADKELFEIANSITFEDITVHKGIVVTSNSFPAPLELFEKIKSKNPLCIDMETSAFYQMGWLFNVPSLAIRGISNCLNRNGVDDKIASSDLKGSSKFAAKITMEIVNKLIYLKYNLVKIDDDEVSQ